MSDHYQSIELLESLHEFPTRFTFKAIGANESTLAARIVAAVREEIGATEDPPTRLRESSGGRHLAVTVEPEVADPQQVLAVYARLRTIEGVIMLL